MIALARVWNTRLKLATAGVTESRSSSSDGTSTAFLHFKFLTAAGEVLGNVQCNSSDLEPGQTEALLMGAATFNLFYSFLAGLLMFIGLYGFALWATKHDRAMLRILLASSQARRRYDPAKHDAIDLEVAPW